MHIITATRARKRFYYDAACILYACRAAAADSEFIIIRYFILNFKFKLYTRTCMMQHAHNVTCACAHSAQLEDVKLLHPVDPADRVSICMHAAAAAARRALYIIIG